MANWSAECWFQTAFSMEWKCVDFNMQIAIFPHILQKGAGGAKALGGSGQGKEALYASTSSGQSGVVNEVPILRFCILEGTVLTRTSVALHWGSWRICTPTAALSITYKY